MPALITHYLCGNAMLKIIEDENITKIIKTHRNVFNLGTQGPDIFFYYGAWPWIDSKVINKFGDRMHEESTGEFILEAVKCIKSAEAADKSILTAYLCGYLCHYALDCCTHPYIFYKSGFVRKNEKYTPKYTCYHRRFETALDVLMLQHELNKKPSDFNASYQINIPKEAAAVIGDMYSKILKTVYNFDISIELVCKAAADMAHISAVLRDKSGFKKRFITWAEKSFRKQPMFSSMILPLEIKDGLDYLNTSHSAWHLPWDNTAAFDTTFIDGFKAAAAESKKLAEALHAFLCGNIDSEDLSTLIGNRSFSTGKNCLLNLEFEYFDCIFE